MSVLEQSTAEELEKALEERRAKQRQVGRLIEKAYNENIRDPLFKGMKNGLITVAGSGVGKGMAVAGLLTVVGTGLAAAGFGSANALTVNGVAPDGLLSSLLAGTQVGFASLFTPVGLAALGAGGLVGAAVSANTHHNQLVDALEVAEARQHRMEEAQQVMAYEAVRAPEDHSKIAPLSHAARVMHSRHDGRGGIGR